MTLPRKTDSEVLHPDVDGLYHAEEAVPAAAPPRKPKRAKRRAAHRFTDDDLIRIRKSIKKDFVRYKWARPEGYVPDELDGVN